VHLPTLLLSPLFTARALVDVSPQALAHAASKFHVARTHTSLDPVLADPEIDVVMITSANEYHVEQAIAALQAGKHVFVEKPLALSLAGADAVAAAAREAGKVCFVGFMRRYAEAFLRVKEMVRAAEGIAYVRVRDIIGHNAYFVGQSGTFPLKFGDTPQAALDDRAARSAAMLAEALGAHSGRDADTWALLTSLAVHDISAMRELIGMPRRVVSASRSADCQWLWATFE
jgi:predicted dehydrogenase